MGWGVVPGVLWHDGSAVCSWSGAKEITHCRLTWRVHDVTGVNGS